MTNRSRRALARRWSVAALALVAMAPQRAQNLPVPKGYVAYRAELPPAIDGKLDDAPWKNVPWSDSFVDIEGNVKPRPRHATRLKMMWDQTHLYIGADLVEPHVWGTLTKHDSVIFRDNDFEVFIDPNGDNHEYYELEINALNTTWDLFLPKPYKDGGKAVDSWEIPGLRTAVHLDGTLNNPRDTDRGWSVEMALPWGAFGQQARMAVPPRNGDQWRINFSRVEWPLERDGSSYQKPPGAKEWNWVWSPQGVIDMHRPERWGYLQFSTQSRGRVAFVPNVDQRRLDWLHKIYYAQRDFKRIRGRWAGTLTELGAPAGTADRALTTLDPILLVTGDQFEASVKVRPDGAERWHIRQDSLIWKK